MTPTSPPDPPRLSEAAVACRLSAENAAVAETVVASAIIAADAPQPADLAFTVDFGDGTTRQAEKARGGPSAAEATHQYDVEGTYAVALTWSTAGRQHTTPCGSITVSAANAGIEPTPSATPDQGILDDNPAIDPSAYVGLDIATAEQQAAAAGLVSRVVSVDGSNNPVTSDYNGSRLNFTVNDGIVTNATLG